MHVGFFAPELPDSGAGNGIVTYVRVMRDALRSLGHRVTVASPGMIERADGTIADIPLPSRAQVLKERLKGRGAHVRALMLNVFDALKGAGVELVEMEESFGFPRLLNGIPLVVRLHGPHTCIGPFMERFDRSREAAELAGIRHADAVSAPTQALLDAMADHTGWRTSRVIENPFPVPAEQWRLQDADPDQILFVGRMDRLKGADIALSAFNEARKKRPSLKLVMVGPGDAPPPTAGVEFTGPLSGPEITALRLRSAVLLHSARFENFPYSIVEAMALGMPVLTSPTFGGLALVNDGSTGRIAMRQEAMAQMLLDMLDPSTLEKLGRNARGYVAEHLDPAMIAAKTLDLYAQVAGKTPAPGLAA